MADRKSTSTSFGTLGRLAVAGMVLAGVATLALTVSSAAAARADGSAPPPLPPGMAPVPEGNKLFLVGHATGTQNYVCRPSGAGVAYVLFTPQATLFGDDGGQIITHYFSPNPIEPNTDPKVVADGTIRATWQYKDSSIVWAKLHQPNGAVTVDQHAIAVAPARYGGSPEGTDGWRQAFQDHLRPAAEHHRRAASVDGLQFADRRR